MSTQCTAQLASKVTHKTPTMKPSVENLAIRDNFLHETYSNDDK